MKRVLIIAYYWPPAGGPGVQRWLNFVKYLPKYGIEPVVYVPENPNYPILDESLLKAVPDVEILKQTISEPYKLAKLFSKKDTKQISSGIIPKEQKQSVIQKLLLFIRGNFFIPDARKSWVKPSVTYLSEYLEQNPVDSIITTGPPHSLHLIGLKLQQKLNVKWIADFRDPWTSIGYHKKLKLMSFAEKKHKALEREVLILVDQIITTSFTTKAEFSEITSQPISVITNGYNAEDFELTETTELDQKFTIAHIGSLLSERNPEVLWQVLSELIEERPDFAEEFQLKLAGTISEDILHSLGTYGLRNHTLQLGYLSHQEAFQQMQKSQVLALIEIDAEETKGIIAGKLFEYLLAKRPILAIGPKNWDVEQIVSETESGHTFGYADAEELKQQILSYFELFQQKKLQVDSKHIERYSRVHLTEQLSEVIKKVSIPLDQTHK